MQTIGEKLLEARQRQGISIREAAEYTKVRGEFLDAMENNQFERIGLADVYKRGFLKIYAKFLHLDPDRIVHEYNSLVQSHSGNSPTSRRLQREVFGRMDVDAAEKNVIAGVTDEKLDTDFTSSALETANRPSADRKKIIRYGLISIGVLAVIFVLMELTSCSDKKSGTPAPTNPVVTTVPQYTMKLYSEERVQVKIVQSSDNKIIFNEPIERSSIAREIVAQGDVIISSPKISVIRVQIGNMNYTSSEANATSFIIQGPVPGQSPQH
ncbi:MAG: helix-turn-helix domain-containing protein [Puniceicoccales bacterium]|jgi:transcriptional regulator with XRE-family HTH domain|nr:helix-turn-helix domain-containing protein [Puniceicoccales bacterium]